MITAQLLSPWAERSGPLGKYPKIRDDYTLVELRSAEARGPLVKATPAAEMAAVVVVCSHEIWAAIVTDPEYRTVHWYQEDGKARRVLGG